MRNNSLSLAKRLTNFFIGLLIGTLIIMGLLKIFSNMLGPFLGVVANISFYYIAKTKHTKNQNVQYIAKGALTSAIISIVAAIIIWIAAFSLYSGVAA